MNNDNCEKYLVKSSNAQSFAFRKTRFGIDKLINL